MAGQTRRSSTRSRRWTTQRSWVSITRNADRQPPNLRRNEPRQSRSHGVGDPPNLATPPHSPHKLPFESGEEIAGWQQSGMRDYFSGDKGVLAFSTLPNNYGPNYGLVENDYTPGYVVFNQEGYGWTSTGLVPGGYGYTTVVHEIGH